ncbi:MAG: amidohydrolase [Deltaproteobacteria bacterium]|nr:amidohydrolase [Deltaproteobacteria bacterium]
MKAIDIHAHPSTQPWYDSMRPYFEALEAYYKTPFRVRKDEEMADEFRRADVGAMVIAWDAETSTKLPVTTNDYTASLRDRFPDAIVGAWASVDPWKGEDAVRELTRAVRDLNMVGVKFQGVAQAFFPNDRRFYPLYEKCVELSVPVQFHTGTTGLGAGTPGGMGLKLKYTQPIHLDDVAADFPGLTVIACHPSWPWQSEMIAILLHKANVYMETSGWSPKYFTPELKKEISGRLQDKIMFGSDYPVLTHERLFRDWDAEKYPSSVIEKIFLSNARRILRLP